MSAIPNSIPSSLTKTGACPRAAAWPCCALIIGESAIFTIFVVAYVYYIGRSAYGPTPQILDVPSSTPSACSRAVSPSGSPSAPSSAGACASSRHGGRSPCCSASSFSPARQSSGHRLIYIDGLTIRTNLFGTTFYSLVGLHATHVVVGLLMLSLVMIFTLLGRVEQRHAERIQVLSLYWHFVDAVWVVVFTVVYIVGR